MRRPVYLLFAILFLAVSCQRVPITGRRQMKLLSNSTLDKMAREQYQEFMRTHTLSSNVLDTEMVKRCGIRIVQAAESYFHQVGKSDYLKGYAWEFNLVEDAIANAWAMPGGKSVVYSGLLTLTQNEDALAVVMGHEVAHALAHHGNERMSQGLAVQMGGLALSVAISQKPQETQNLFLNAYGVGTAVGGLLPFSRLHESEADEIGLILMAIAGYDPEAAPPFWKRMDEASNGQAPPTFLSTHPSHNNRIENLKELIPKAKAYAKKYGGKD